jgi:hypothetical protein
LASDGINFTIDIGTRCYDLAIISLYLVPFTLLYPILRDLQKDNNMIK